MSKLIIIEAAGKILSVKKAAASIWGPGCDVVATGGYLSTLPNDQIGVDLNTFEPINLAPSESYYYLTTKFQKWRHAHGKKGPWESIVILTDPDREGEGIAAQSYELIKKWFPEAPVERVYAHELSPEGLRMAEISETLHKGTVMAQKARMVLDRLLPFAASCALHKPGEFKGLGRLQLESVKVIKQNISKWKRFLVEGTWRNKAGGFWISHRTDSNIRANEIIDILRHTKVDPSLIVSKEDIVIEAPRPHSAFTLMSTLTSLRPEVVMEKAQLAYMQARISYPRTDQRILGKTGLYTMAAMVDSYHLGSRLSKDWNLIDTAKKESWVQGAHSALHPLINWTPPAEKDSFLVESEIVARAMASLMAPVKLTKTTVTVDAGSAGWVDAFKYDVIDAGWSIAYERLGLSNPVIPKLTFGKKMPTIVENFPTPSVVISWLSDAHLGRPSTLSNVPMKLQELGLLSSACAPTTLGEKHLSDVMAVMPMLANPDFTTLMERGLSHLIEKPEDYTEVVKSLLVEAGVDIVGLPDMINVTARFESAVDSNIDSEFMF